MNIVDCWVLLIFLPHLLYVLYIMNVYKKSKSLVNTRKEEEEKGEKKSPRFFFSSFRVL